MTFESIAPEDQKKRKRRMAQRYINSKEYRPEFKAALSEEAIYYYRLPNNVTKKEAAALVDILGEFKAEEAAFDMNNGMNAAVRFTVIQDLIDKNESRGEFEKAGELAEKLLSKSTEFGQGL